MFNRIKDLLVWLTPSMLLSAFAKPKYEAETPGGRRGGSRGGEGLSRSNKFLVGARASVRFRKGMKYMFYASWGSVAIILLVLLFMLAGYLRTLGGGTARVESGEQATEITTEAPWTPQDEVPYAATAPADSAGAPAPIPNLKKLPVADPDLVDYTISTGAEGHPVVVMRRHEDLLFPEFRGPGAAYDPEVICPGDRFTPAECDSARARVAVSYPARPFFELDPEPLAGFLAAPEPGGSSVLRGPREAQFYVGADLLRMGPLHLQAGFAAPLARRDSLSATAGPGASGAGESAASIAGRPVHFAPGAGVQVTEDLYFSGSVLWDRGKAAFGVNYEF